MRFAQKKNIAALVALINKSLTILLVCFLLFIRAAYQQVELDLMGGLSNPPGIPMSTTWLVCIAAGCFLILDWLFTIRWTRSLASARFPLFWLTLLHLVVTVLCGVQFFSYSFNRSWTLFTALVVFLILWTLVVDVVLIAVMKKDKSGA